MSKPETYEQLSNALRTIENVAIALPTFKVKYEGGIEEATKNVVEAISKAGKQIEKKITLEEFAKSAGVTIVQCDSEWGGKVAYKEKDYPNSRICGFRTEKAAYNSWLKSKFGYHTSKAIVKLLKA